MTWNLASNPPKGEPGKWAHDKVVFTNFGKTFTLSYYTNVTCDGGTWQRPAAFEPGERVEFWIDPPEDA